MFRYAASFSKGLDASFLGWFLFSLNSMYCIALAVQVGWAVSALVTKTGSALETSEETSASPWLVSLPCPPDWVVRHSARRVAYSTGFAVGDSCLLAAYFKDILHQGF